MLLREVGHNLLESAEWASTAVLRPRLGVEAFPPVERPPAQDVEK